MVDMNVELQAACTSFGYLEKGTYYKEPDCLETIKDVIRFLKREDESCEIRRQIGESQIVQNDLIPLVKQYKEDIILLETTLRLLVNLSQPAVLCFQNQIPGDKTNRNYYLQIEGHLQSYKQAFADEALLAVLTRKLGDLLQLDWEARQEEDRLLIERILILIRNILHVPPNTIAEGRTDDDATIHDQLLWALHVSGMEDLLLYLGSSDDERQFAFHVLEIISLMFREQTPEQLAAAGGARALSERQQDQRELEMAREQEKSMKKAKIMKYSSRHSRFGGTFTVANVKSITNNQLITHRSLGQIKDMNFDHNKVPKKIAKNRRPLTGEEVTRRSTLSIRLFLKEFCIQFLENCYNPLMKAVKDILNRSTGQENDETYYLWAMRFFMEFNRKQRKALRVDLVGETLSVQAFHYVQTNLQTYHEMILTNKNEGKTWSRRMHLALRAYHELLQSVNAMSLSKNQQLKDNADIIKGNVFYMMEYRDIFLVLLKKFNEALQSRAFLRDLIETTHLFIKMLEQYCKMHGHLVVQKKKKKVKKKKTRTTEQAPQSTNANVAQEQLDDLWDEISGELSAIFQGRGDIPADILPFDAASDTEVDMQRAQAMIRIQNEMREKRAGSAVALFRAAREVWPEQEQFGSQDISPEDEFMALREVFFADIPRPVAAQTEEFEETELTDASDDDEEEGEIQYESMEQDFDFKGYIRRFSQPTVVKPYAILLKDYKKNSAYTNHSIIKQLHRIGFDCNMVAMLFQASLFRVFQQILFDPSRNSKHLQEMAGFAKHVVRRFFETASTNPKVFVELFFWKSAKESMEVTEGYGTSVHAVKQQWTEEQDDELQRLYNEFKDKEPEEGMDVIDHIMVHIIDQKKTRRQILKQMKWLGIIESSSDLKAKKTTQKRGWQEEEEMQLRQIFDQFKDSDDPVNNIINGLDRPRSRPMVLNKLLELGLIQDKRELKKKRKSTAGSRKKKKKDDDIYEDEVEDNMVESEDENIQEEPLDLPEEGNVENPDLESFSSSSDDSSSSDSDEESEDPRYVIQIRKCIKKVKKGPYKDEVQWIANCLNRCAEDREEDEDDDQPIPIVPITEEQESAMEDKHFKDLLKKCGVKPPANEQERFWRIPGELKPLDLRSRATAVTTEKPSAGEQSENSKKKNEKMEAMRDLIKKRSEETRQSRKDRHKASKTVTPNSDKKKKSRVKRALPSDSDSSGDDDRLLIDLKSKPSSSKKQKITNSDSESDKENSQNPTSTQPPSSYSSSQSQTQNSQTQNSTQSSQSQSQRSRSRSQRSRSRSQRSRSRSQRSRSGSASSRGSRSSRSRSGSSRSRSRSGSSRRSSRSSSGSRSRPSSTQGSRQSSSQGSRPSSSQKSRQSSPQGSRSNSPVSQSQHSSRPSSPATNNTTDNLQTFPATMLSQPMSDDDSDIDDHIPLKHMVNKKKKALIASDSEED